MSVLRWAVPGTPSGRSARRRRSGRPARWHPAHNGLPALLLVALAGAGCARTGPSPTPGAEDPRYELAIERGRNIVRPLVRRGSGVAVAVGVDGRLVWSEGFGRTHRSGGVPVTPEMPFRVYSLMKPVTAVLALQSAGRGEVDLQGSIRRVLASLPEHYEQVTLAQLLTHTAGVRHYRTVSEASMTGHCATAADALPMFVGDPLVAEPGQRQIYSTWGFVLASAALEAAAGLPFDSLLALRVLHPAGMTSTFLEGPTGSVSVVAYYEVDADGRTTEAAPVDNSCKMGGGGFLASAADLVRFHNAVLRGELIPLPAARQMLAGRSVLDSGGSGPGGQAVSRVDLDSGISVVILSNTRGLEQEIALDRARGLLAEIFAARDEMVTALP